MSKQYWEDKILIASSAIALCTCWGIAAAENLSISRMDTKIAADVCFPICEEIME